MSSAARVRSRSGSLDRQSNNTGGGDVVPEIKFSLFEDAAKNCTIDDPTFGAIETKGVYVWGHNTHGEMGSSVPLGHF
jgi:alpha-tubulin suppressor-like RCC1 family protein